MTDPILEDLFAWFTQPYRYKSIDPKRAIWLTDDNIRNLAKDEKFMAGFYARRVSP